MNEIAGTILFFLILIAAGWFVFSFAAGVIVYLSSMTTNHAALEPKSMMESEKKSILNAHTKDPLVMDTLNAAKERWLQDRASGAFEVVSVTTPDGLNLTAYYQAAKKAGGAGRTVLLVHGMMDSAAGMAYLSEEYLRRGWNVLSVDQRAHGESEGTKRTMGVLESKDLSLWVNLLVSRFGSREIFLHGISMGGVAVLMYGAVSGKKVPEVKGLVADSCFASHRTTLYRLLYQATGNSFVARSLVLGADFASAIFSGIGFGRMETIKAVRANTLPTILFHGQKDVLVPLTSMSGIFAEAVKRGADIVVIPQAPHIGSYFYSPELYMSKILEFSGRIP